MILRLALFALLALLVLRAFWRVVDGIIEGASPRGRSTRGTPDRGVQMVRDPVCGTFLLPSSALALTDRNGSVTYFCSEKCRQAYHRRPPDRS
jgi:uncharacterized protein